MTKPSKKLDEQIEKIISLPHIQEFYDWCEEEEIDEKIMYKIAGWLGGEIYLKNILATKALNQLITQEKIKELKDLNIIDEKLDNRIATLESELEDKK